MAKKVIWSPASEEDLYNILEYLQLHWNQTVITKFINRIDDSVGLILLDPEMFPLINKQLNIRKLVVTKHNTLYYRIAKNKNIEIVRLFDSRQDPDKLTFQKK